MTNRIWFVYGATASGLLLLHHTYEAEKYKQDIQLEITKIKRLSSFNIEQLAISRPDTKLSLNPSLDSLSTRFTYFNE